MEEDKNIYISFELKSTNNIVDNKINTLVCILSNIRDLQNDKFVEEGYFKSYNRMIEDMIKILETMKYEIVEE